MKTTWNGQHLHFVSFTPIAYKCGLVKTRYHSARSTCKPNALPVEHAFFRETFIGNGYPAKFTDVHSQQ